MVKLVILGSNSIHTRRFIRGVLDNSDFALTIITNSQMAEFSTTPQYCLNFSLSSWSTVGKLRQILADLGPEVVHIHQANSYAWHSLRAIQKLNKRPRVILTTWGSDILLLPKQHWLLAKMVRYNLRHADIITSDSLYLSASIQELLADVSRPICTINFGIQAMPTKQDLQRKAKIILSNRLHKPLYRVDKIIQAFALLVKDDLIDPEYQLVIAASGPESSNLQCLVDELGLVKRVQFTAMLSYSALVSYYQQAEIFVSVPNSDGTASSLLEGMAYGCIPVLSNLPANLEWVLDQVNGFICPNVDELHTQILAAINLGSDRGAYQKLYDFNYSLIASKATFANNIHKFMELYH